MYSESAAKKAWCFVEVSGILIVGVFPEDCGILSHAHIVVAWGPTLRILLGRFAS